MALLRIEHERKFQEERQKLELANIRFEERLEQERLAREDRKREPDLARRQRLGAVIAQGLASPDPVARTAAMEHAFESGDVAFP